MILLIHESLPYQSNQLFCLYIFCLSCCDGVNFNSIPWFHGCLCTYINISVSIECFGLVVVIMLISIQFNSMVVFAHIYTSFIDSRGTDPSVVYLRSHHVIQDFFLLLPENLSTLRYLIKIFGWFDSSFLSCLFCQVVPLSFCHWVIESFCHTVPPLAHFPWTWTIVFLYFFL